MRIILRPRNMNPIGKQSCHFWFAMLLFASLGSLNLLAEPAAAWPFGMVKLAPDTEIFGYYRTGYQNSQTNPSVEKWPCQHAVAFKITFQT